MLGTNRLKCQLRVPWQQMKGKEMDVKVGMEKIELVAPRKQTANKSTVHWDEQLATQMSNNWQHKWATIGNTNRQHLSIKLRCLVCLAI